ncbi:VOC family protein [Pseudonocardia sp.]|uniref:VOC family protein n=1 Tax=Pseudonocardia sp. TaxID=60912 RepID=UPI002B4AAF9A|nr:VOC family protein [Pseudonocardia sp.]
MTAYLHHTGHVVRDIAAAAACYRRLGFAVPAPEFPALPPAPGRPPRAVGAGNTHVQLGRGFVELVTVVDGDGPPADAVVVPLDVPLGAAERVSAGIAATAARLSSALARFEGLHILVLGTSDADATAARLTAGGVPHGGVQRVHRPGPAGGVPVPIGWLELDPDAPEGRLAVAEDLAGAGRADHPNGALELVEVLLCVPDDELAAHTRRYRRYLDRPARDEGPLRSFELDSGRITLVAASGVDGVLPGERPPALPAFAGYVVTVRRPDDVRALVAGAGFPLRTTPAGDLFVPAAAAHGAAVVFRAA